MRQYRILLVALAASLASSATACHNARPAEAGEPAPEAVVLNVKNEYTTSMDLFAVASGQPTRIGTVSAFATKAFVLKPAVYTVNDFRVIATPAGGVGRASTGRLTPHPGQTIDFIIASRLEASRVEIHEP